MHILVLTHRSNWYNELTWTAITFSSFPQENGRFSIFSRILILRTKAKLKRKCTWKSNINIRIGFNDSTIMSNILRISEPFTIHSKENLLIIMILKSAKLNENSHFEKKSICNMWSSVFNDFIYRPKNARALHGINEHLRSCMSSFRSISGKLHFNYTRIVYFFLHLFWPLCAASIGWKL